MYYVLDLTYPFWIILFSLDSYKYIVQNIKFNRVLSITYIFYNPLFLLCVYYIY